MDRPRAEQELAPTLSLHDCAILGRDPFTDGRQISLAAMFKYLAALIRCLVYSLRLVGSSIGRTNTKMVRTVLVFQKYDEKKNMAS